MKQFCLAILLLVGLTSCIAPESVIRATVDASIAQTQGIIPRDDTTTSTIEAIPTVTPTLSPTEEDLVGSGVEISQDDHEGSDLVFYIYKGDGTAVEDKYVAVYTQKQDLSGNWVTDERVDRGYTDNSGKIEFDLTPGNYIIHTDLAGYNWGSSWDVPGQANIEVIPAKTTRVILRLGRIQVGFVRANGSVYKDKYVAIYTQKEDIAGNLVTSNRADRGYTDNSGVKIFNLPAGYYIVSADFDGYNWGSTYDVMGQANIPLRAGEEYHLTVNLGQIVVALRDNGGNPITNKYVAVYYQKQDINGDPSYGERVNRGYTDNTGSITFNLTPGLYSVYFDEVYHYNIEVLEGSITLTDGIDQQIQE